LTIGGMLVPNKVGFCGRSSALTLLGAEGASCAVAPVAIANATAAAAHAVRAEIKSRPAAT
jgi:hypothetical protein